MVSPKHDVALAYLHSDELAANFHASLFNLFGYDMSHEGRILHHIRIKTTLMGLPQARNRACQETLDSPCQWLFFVDSDMGFEPWALDQLLLFADPVERPIVGGLCFSQRTEEIDGRNGFRCYPRVTIFEWREQEDGSHRFNGALHYPINTLVRCGATGGAFVLIHRSVLEKIGGDWFTQTPDETGQMQGEDISFFDRCRKLEIPVHIHTGIRTTHYKHLWLAEEDFWQSFLAPPATEPVDVIVPVLHRPQNVKPLMESLRASTGLARAWFVCEPEDNEEIFEVLTHGGRFLEHAGTFSEKVNWAYGAIEDGAPWVLLVGDDVRFRPGWLDQAQDVARRYKASVVGTNDLANPRVQRGEHTTHPMISRRYIDEVGAGWDGPGTVCHEGYRHWFVDDEIVTAAKQRGTFQVALASEVEHMHPNVGKAPMDEIYELGTRSAADDQKLFERRLAASTAPNREARRHPERPKLLVAR